MADDDVPRSYISKIELENFMSHRKFEVELSSTLNLIVGRNGSGKSSVLTALIVALGGRASATSRSNAVSDLVRTGAEAAYITIHFVNSPANASLLLKYGAEFTVQRRISGKKQNGQLYCTNTYSIRNFAGKEVSKKAKDVQDIAIQFGIFPDNPLAMLTQEQAKEFLVTASASKKYQRLKAALYQHHLSRHRQEVEQNMETNRKTIEQGQMQQKHIESNIENLDKILQQAAELASREAYTKKLKALVAWRSHAKRKKVVAARSAQVMRIRRDLAKLEEDGDLTKKLDEYRAEHEQLHQQLVLVDQAVKQGEEETSQLDANLDKSRRRLQLVKKEIEAAKSDQSRALKTLHVLEGDIAAESPEEVARKRQSLEEEIRQLQDQVEPLQLEIEDLVRREAEIDPKVDATKEELTSLNARIRDVKLEAESTNDKIHRSMGQHSRRGDLPSGFSREYEYLDKLIKRASWKGKPPVGPLGHYIDLKSEFSDYLPMIQMVYLAHLGSYWVQTAEDETALSRLMKEAGVFKSRIVNRDVDNWNYHQVVPRQSGDYDRIIEDVLSFRSDDVARALIDLGRAESHVILRDPGSDEVEQSNKLITDGSRKIMTVFVASRNNNNGLSFGNYHRSGNTVGYNTVAAFHGGPRVHLASDAEVKNLKSLLAQLKGDLASLKSEQDDLSMRLSEQETLRSRLRRKQRELQQKLEEGAYRERALRNELLQLPSDEDLVGAPSRHAEQLAEARQQLEACNEAISSSQFAQQSAEDQVNGAKMARDRSRSTLEQLRGQLNEIRQRLHAVTQSQSQTERAQQFAQATLSHKRDELEEAEAAEQNELGILGDIAARALELGPSPQERPEVYQASDLDLRTAQLEEKLDYLKAVASQSAVSPEKLEKTRLEKERQLVAYESNQRTLAMCQSMAEKVAESHEKRTLDSARMWAHARTTIMEKFADLLAQRRFKGDLDIDDEKETLETSATPEQSASRAASTLSGGERSFSQIALLISVWGAMHAGLVAVDEYDVFMDKANRAVSLNLLTESVRAHHMQCLLITPQDIDLQAVDPSFREHIRVHRLRPPVREQT